MLGFGGRTTILSGAMSIVLVHDASLVSWQVSVLCTCFLWCLFPYTTMQFVMHGLRASCASDQARFQPSLP